MKNRLNFLKEYLKEPKKTGSLTPSSKYLTKQILSSINFKEDLIIIEFGAGNGVFSEEIIKRKTKKTKLIIIEINSNFCEELKNKFKNEENVFIINDDVLNLNSILNYLNLNYIDYVISALPFLSLGKNFSEEVFKLVKVYLKKEFILFQYTTIILKTIKKHFSNIEKKIVFKNIPPAFIFIIK